MCAFDLQPLFIILLDPDGLLSLHSQFQYHLQQTVPKIKTYQLCQHCNNEHFHIVIIEHIHTCRRCYNCNNCCYCQRNQYVSDHAWNSPVLVPTPISSISIAMDLIACSMADNFLIIFISIVLVVIYSANIQQLIKSTI